MEIRWDIVEELWGHSNGQFISVGEIQRPGRKFSETLIQRSSFVPPAQGEQLDLFFSALSFAAPFRRNDAFAGASMLYADLDPVDPRELELVPSIAWETSPGNYQAAWFLTEFLQDPAEWRLLNRRMTITTKADANGWGISKLLRVPGSLNYKRAEPGFIPRGRVIIDNRIRYGSKYLKKVLEPATLAEDPDGDAPPLPTLEERAQIVHEMWDRLSLRAKWMFSPKFRVGDRSMHIVKCILELRHFTDLTPEEMYRLIGCQPWNKFRYRPDRLWAEITREVC